MKFFRQRPRPSSIGIILFLGALKIASAQTAVSDAATLSKAPMVTPPLTAAEQAVRQEQGALAQEQEALSASKATTQQIAAWQQQNAPRLAAQLQRATDLAAANAPVAT